MWPFSGTLTAKWGLSVADLEALNSGQPIIPHHDPAHSLQEAGIGCLIQENEQAFFDDFAQFGTLLNERRLAETPWRIQEHSNVMIGAEDPAHGRRYFIFYNSFSIGSMDVGPGINLYTGLFSSYAEKPYVSCDIIIDYPLALRHSAIKEFIIGVANLACAGDKSEFDNNLSRITNAMLEALWDGISNPEYASALSVTIEGTPRVYHGVRETRKEPR